MLTIIFPGYSLHNKQWAEEVAGKLTANSLPTKVHYWQHWTGGKFSLRNEIETLLEEIGNEKVNILAKSVGVAVAFELIPKIFKQVDKVILCGIASISEDRKLDAYEAFSKIPVKNILCIQNDKDKFVIFENAKSFYHAVNPSIEVISKPRADHEYPYFEDFKNFFKS